MRNRLLMLGLSVCCAFTSVCADAQGKLDLGSRLVDPLAATAQSDPLASPRRGRTSLTPADAARQVQKLYGGRVLAVQQDADGYRVKVLKDGEVRIYSVSPQE